MDPRLEELLRQHLPYLAPDQRLAPDSALKDLGLDSMQAVELLFDIEEVFDVSLPDERLTAETFATAEALNNVIDSELARERS